MRALRRWVRGKLKGDAELALLGRAYCMNLLPGIIAGLRLEDATWGVEMIEHRPMRAAGNAMVWKLVQMGGVKVIYMVRLLVLAILLTPTDFGLVAIATSATGFLLGLTNVGLIPAVVQAENMDDEKYDAAWTFDMSRSFIVATLTIIFSPVIADIFAEPLAVPIIQALALRPLIESLTSIKVAALNRNLTFRPLAYLRIVEAIFNTVVSIALAKFIGVWALVFGPITGALAMVIASYILVPYRPRITLNWHAIKPLMNFGGWILITGLVAMVGSYGLRIAISRQLGAEGLGLFFIAVQLAYLPSEVASEAVGAVAFPLFARLQSNVVAGDTGIPRPAQWSDSGPVSHLRAAHCSCSNFNPRYSGSRVGRDRASDQCSRPGRHDWCLWRSCCFSFQGLRSTIQNHFLGGDPINGNPIPDMVPDKPLWIGGSGSSQGTCRTSLPNNVYPSARDDSR